MRKLWALPIAACGLALAFAPRQQDVYLVVTGDFQGQLSPCGCTKPMTGGIKRAAAVVTALRRSSTVLVVSNGALTGDAGRQQEMKAAALSESLKAMGTVAIGLSVEDSRLGFGTLSTIQSLSGGKLVTGASANTSLLKLPQTVVASNITLASASTRPDEIAKVLGGDARALSDQLSVASDVLLLDGNELAARNAAESNPALKIVVYRSNGDAPKAPIKVGDTWLVSPGSEGKAVLKIKMVDGKPTEYTGIPLVESIADDQTVRLIYQSYLHEVSDSNLLESVPKLGNARYTGSQTCVSCHAKATRIWQHSAHSTALNTLKQENHDRDPDCVSCHVVGFESKRGFVSPAKTPRLGGVGCESCHGAGYNHSVRPKAYVLPKVGASSCAKCHVPTHSPGFDFKRFWPKISH